MYVSGDELFGSFELRSWGSDFSKFSLLHQNLLWETYCCYCLQCLEISAFSWCYIQANRVGSTAFSSKIFAFLKSRMCWNQMIHIYYPLLLPCRDENHQNNSFDSLEIVYKIKYFLKLALVLLYGFSRSLALHWHYFLHRCEKLFFAKKILTAARCAFRIWSCYLQFKNGLNNNLRYNPRK